MRQAPPPSPLPLFDTLHVHVSSAVRQLPAHHADLSHHFNAHADYQQAYDFLYSYRGSQATFNAYRREIERFLLWSWYVHHDSIQCIKRHDAENYIVFCQSPPSSWIGKKQVARFTKKHTEPRVPNPQWRPYIQLDTTQPSGSYNLSQKSMQALFAILGSFYHYMIQEDYIAYNPFVQIRQKSKFLRKKQYHTPVKRLSDLQWMYVLDATEKLAASHPEQHERTLFIIHALYSMYLRISELAASERWTPTMSDFARDREGNWWFTTVGKGNKERIIPVSNAMLMALKRYRRALGLTALPSPQENRVLISKQKGYGPVTSTRQIRKIVQCCFDEAMYHLRADGFCEEAELLRDFTVHGLRHTGISEDVRHRPIQHVRDDAGHSSSLITDKYVDVEMRKRHLSKKQRPIKIED